MQVYKVEIRNGNNTIIYGLVTKAKMLEIMINERQPNDVITVEVLAVGKSQSEG